MALGSEGWGGREGGREKEGERKRRERRAKGTRRESKERKGRESKGKQREGRGGEGRERRREKRRKEGRGGEATRRGKTLTELAPDHPCLKLSDLFFLPFPKAKPSLSPPAPPSAVEVPPPGKTLTELASDPGRKKMKEGREERGEKAGKGTQSKGIAKYIKVK